MNDWGGEARIMCIYVCGLALYLIILPGPARRVGIRYEVGMGLCLFPGRAGFETDSIFKRDCVEPGSGTFRIGFYTRK